VNSLLTRDHSHYSHVGLLGEAQFVCAGAVQMAARMDCRMLSYVVVGECKLVRVALDYCALVATTGNLPPVRRSVQAAARNYCYSCSFGYPGTNSCLHSRARRRPDLVEARMAAEDCCSLAVGFHNPAAVAHTAVVYQGSVLGPVVIDGSLDMDGLA